MKQRFSQIYIVKNEAYRFDAPDDLIEWFKAKTIEKASKQIKGHWTFSYLDWLKDSVLITVEKDCGKNHLNFSKKKVDHLTLV
jgi:hypothetical protein